MKNLTTDLVPHSEIPFTSNKCTNFHFTVLAFLVSSKHENEEKQKNP